MTRQYLTAKFNPDDSRAYTYHNDGPPSWPGDQVMVVGKGGGHLTTVTVAAILTDQPEFATKPVMGKADKPGLAEQALRHVQYIRNTAQVPLMIGDFDDDWTPCGDIYREYLREHGLVEYVVSNEGEPIALILTAAGETVL